MKRTAPRYFPVSLSRRITKYIHYRLRVAQTLAHFRAKLLSQALINFLYCRNKFHGTDCQIFLKKA